MFPTKCPVCKQNTLTHDEDSIYCTNCRAYNKKLNIFRRHLAWAQTKTGWWWRALILLVFGIWLIENWHNPQFALDRITNPYSALDFGIHELGHYLFSVFGEFMRIAGGSLFQLIFPFIAMAGFYQIRCYFAAVMCWPWLGMSLFDVATYVADAQARLLPLATGLAGLGQEHTDELYDRGHDWYQLLTRTNLLHADQTIALGLRFAATIAFVIGLAVGGILVVQMAKKALHTFSRQH